MSDKRVSVAAEFDSVITPRRCDGHFGDKRSDRTKSGCVVGGDARHDSIYAGLEFIRGGDGVGDGDDYTCTSVAEIGVVQLIV